MQNVVFRILTGARANQEVTYALSDLKAPITVGRDPASRLNFEEADDAVSRHHASIERVPDSEADFTIKDLKSANGVLINGVKISESARLQHGDIIQFGRGGPEVSFKLDPPPANAMKATRVVADYVPKATREASAAELGATAAPTGDQPRPIGRATVERMIGEEKSSSRRNLLNVGAVAVALIVALGAWQYFANEQTRKEQAAQAGALKKQKDDAEKKASELLARTDVAARIKESYAKATVYVDVAWHLIHTSSGKQVIHEFVRPAQGADPVPLYVRLQNGYLEPSLSLDPNSGRAIGGTHTGSGFVVSPNGLIMTNRHVAAAWHSIFELPFPGVVRSVDQQTGRAVYEKVEGLPSGQPRWVPARSQILGARGVADKTVNGRLDALFVVFPNSKLRVPAQPGTNSPEHDVSLIKIDALPNLTTVELRDNYDSIKSGDVVVSLGYPGVSAKSLYVTKSQDMFQKSADVAVVTDVSVNQGIVSKVVRGKLDGTNNESYVSTRGDVYELSINSAGPGNSGGPVFDVDGKVIGVYTGGSAVSGSAISWATPIRYGIELLDPTKTVGNK
jgi:serine protease Do